MIDKSIRRRPVVVILYLCSVIGYGISLLFWDRPPWYAYVLLASMVAFAPVRYSALRGDETWTAPTRRRQRAWIATVLGVFLLGAAAAWWSAH